MYTLLKVVHIGAFLFWLGPALGAWLVLKAAGGDDFSSNTMSRISRMFFHLITLEHIAFAVLLITGVMMALDYGWFGSGWLSQKLLIVGVIVIPLELVDIWLGNYKASLITRELYKGNAVSASEQKLVGIYHGVFTRIALFLIPVSVFLILWLAVGKQPLF